jgi:hypothetical protein
MKAIILGTVSVIVMMVALQFQGGETITYIKESVTPEVVAPIVEKWQTDEEAIQAAKDVIRKKELEAELASLDSEIKDKQARRKAVTDELTTY